MDGHSSLNSNHPCSSYEGLKSFCLVPLIFKVGKTTVPILTGWHLEIICIKCSLATALTKCILVIIAACSLDAILTRIPFDSYTTKHFYSKYHSGGGKTPLQFQFLIQNITFVSLTTHHYFSITSIKMSYHLYPAFVADKRPYNPLILWVPF